MFPNPDTKPRANRFDTPGGTPNWRNLSVVKIVRRRESKNVDVGERMSLESDSNLTRLEQIKKKVKEYKYLLRQWERLETEEVILISKGESYGIR